MVLPLFWNQRLSKITHIKTKTSEKKIMIKLGHSVQDCGWWGELIKVSENDKAKKKRFIERKQFIFICLGYGVSVRLAKKIRS